MSMVVCTSHSAEIDFPFKCFKRRTLTYDDRYIFILFSTVIEFQNGRIRFSTIYAWESR